MSEIVSYAKQNDLKLVVRGRGHSTAGQAQSQSAVIDTSCLNTVFEVNTKKGYIHIGAGASWNDVVNATSEVGYRPKAEVWTKILSVGGTLSIGGGGPLAASEGYATQHVKSLTVVAGGGDIYYAKPSFRHDIFNGILGGQGQFAVITEVELEIVPIESTFRSYVLMYNNYDEFAAELYKACTSGTMSALSSIAANNQYGRESLGTLFPTILNNTEIKPLVDYLFGNETAVEYVYVVFLGDPLGHYIPNYTNDSKLTLPLAASAGIDSYLALSYGDTKEIELEAETDEYYLPRNVLALELPASEPDVNSTWDLVYKFFPDIFENPSAAVGMQYLKKEVIATNTFTAWPQDTDVLVVQIILSSFFPDPEEFLSTVAASYAVRDFLNDMFEAFYYNPVTAGVKLYPYGFTPDIYTWEYHYGSNWPLLQHLKHEYDRKDVLGNGVAIFGPRV